MARVAGWIRLLTKKIIMKIELSPNEMWKIMDAIEAYKKDYAVSGAVEKTLNGVVSKLKSKIHKKC